MARVIPKRNTDPRAGVLAVNSPVSIGNKRDSRQRKDESPRSAFSSRRAEICATRAVSRFRSAKATFRFFAISIFRVTITSDWNDNWCAEFLAYRRNICRKCGIMLFQIFKSQTLPPFRGYFLNYRAFDERRIIANRSLRLINLEEWIVGDFVTSWSERGWYSIKRRKLFIDGPEVHLEIRSLYPSRKRLSVSIE